MRTGQKLLRITEASEILGVYPNTLRKWDRKGILKAVSEAWHPIGSVVKWF